MPQRPQKPVMMLHSSKGVSSTHTHLSNCSNDNSSGFCYLSVLSGGDRGTERGQGLGDEKE